MVSGIYSITNKINGKRYIGSSENIKIRWKNHKHFLKFNKSHSPHLQNAWNKYGEDNFIFEVLEYIQDKNELLKVEQYYLDWFESYKSEFGYNTCQISGNTSGRKHSIETKNKLRLLNLGRKVTEETKLKISISGKGRKRSLETRKRMSSSQKNRKFSLETREKMSVAKNGKTLSKETKDKMSFSKNGDKNPNFGKTGKTLQYLAKIIVEQS